MLERRVIRRKLTVVVVIAEQNPCRALTAAVLTEPGSQTIREYGWGKKTKNNKNLPRQTHQSSINLVRPTIDRHRKQTPVVYPPLFILLT